MRMDRIALGVALALAAATALAQERTVVKDDAEAQLLLEARGIALQWISWDRLGKVEVEKKDGLIRLRGTQEQKKGEDYLKVEGVVTEVRSRVFILKGSVVTRISHIASGRPCTREGTLTFRRTGKRRYWRMQQMHNPCDGVTDYVDVFLPEKKPPAKK